jgi:hypothetical protein
LIYLEPETREHKIAAKNYLKLWRGIVAECDTSAFSRTRRKSLCAANDRKSHGMA